MKVFRKKIIIHTHVEKAAGTSIVEGLRDGLGSDHVHDMRSPTAKMPQTMTPAEKMRIWVLTGHFHYGAHMNRFAKSKVFIASVRHPFDRFRSYVNYVKSGHPAYKRIGGKTFATVIEEYLKEKHPQADNQMARVLTGSKSPTFDMVKKHIEQNYLFVAPHRRVNEAVSALLSITAEDTLTAELHRNKGDKKPPEDVGIWEERFNAANTVDIDLHQYVVDNFDRWMETLGDRWESISAVKVANDIPDEDN